MTLKTHHGSCGCQCCILYGTCMVLLQGLNNVDALKRLKLECLNCSMDGTRLLVSRYSACHLTGCGIKFDLQYNFFCSPCRTTIVNTSPMYSLRQTDERCSSNTHKVRKGCLTSSPSLPHSAHLSCNSHTWFLFRLNYTGLPTEAGITYFEENA